MTPSNVPILTEELTDLLARYNLKAVPLEETKPEYYELSIRTPTNINLSDLESEIQDIVVQIVIPIPQCGRNP